MINSTNDVEMLEKKLEWNLMIWSQIFWILFFFSFHDSVVLIHNWITVIYNWDGNFWNLLDFCCDYYLLAIRWKKEEINKNLSSSSAIAQ